MAHLEYIINLKVKLKKDQIKAINEDLKSHHFEWLGEVTMETLQLKGYRLKPQKSKVLKEVFNPYLSKDWYQ